MKSILMFCAGILFLILAARSSFAQISGKVEEKPVLKKADKKGVMSSRTPVFSSMKKDTLGILELDYPGVARKFAALFPVVAQQVWIKEEGVLFVSFFKDGYKVNAVFTMNGQMNYSIANRDAADLPWHILQKIKYGYTSCSIFNCSEIWVNGDTIYEVVLENSSGYILLRAYDNEITEIQKLQKS